MMSTNGMKVGATFTCLECAVVESGTITQKFLLSCPFHLLAYEIECLEGAEMLVHSIMKMGHSNWLEASHIHFRPKHINLERLHYVV